MPTFASVEELRTAEGNELGVGDWIDVTQEKVDAFAELTGDHQWIHVDPERAAATPLGSTIAHGYLVLSMIAPAVMSLVQLENTSKLLNYGMNRVRFPSSVPTGARIRARLALQDVADSGRGCLYTLRATVEVEGQDRPGCVADVLTFAEFGIDASAPHQPSADA